MYFMSSLLKLSIVSLIISLSPLDLFAANQERVTFFLLRGIGRESGHWGNTFTNYVKNQIPSAQFVLMDLPGAGRYYNKPALSTIEKMADFLRTEHLTLMDSLEGKKVIVATSLAGNVALEWVMQYPGDFQGAILLSTSLKRICKGKERVQPEAKKQFVNIFLTDDIKEREKEFLSINSNLNVGNDSLLNAWENIQKLRPVAKGALLKQTVAGMVYKPRRAEPTIPVLLIGSKTDKIVAETCFRKVAKALNGDLYLHEHAGHGIPVDVPQWLADTTSYWTLNNVLSYYPPDSISTDVTTRDKDNGLFPVKWLDNGVSSVGQVSTQAYKGTEQVFTDSWQWMDDSISWIGKFTRILHVKDKQQKNQFKALRKTIRQQKKSRKKSG